MDKKQLDLFQCFKGLVGYTLWTNPYGDYWYQVSEELNPSQNQAMIRQIITVLSKFLKKNKGGFRKMAYLAISMEVVFNQGSRMGANFTVQIMDLQKRNIGTICQTVPNPPNDEDYYWIITP